MSIDSILAKRRFVITANKFQHFPAVMSASAAKTNYLIFAALAAFLSISTLPQLCLGQSECCVIQRYSSFQIELAGV